MAKRTQYENPTDNGIRPVWIIPHYMGWGKHIPRLGGKIKLNGARNLKKEGDCMREIIATDKAPAAIGPYSQAIQFANLLFVSGQIPLDPETGQIIDGDIKVQTERVLGNLKAIVEAGGMTLKNVVECTCFLQNMEDFAEFNSVYTCYFADILPAREAVEVSRLPKDVLVEISAICGK
jgi:2-iminobutanoate/2-iminopropanoate deaminase